MPTFPWVKPSALFYFVYCFLILVLSRFIGELYKLKMLTENIMHDCIIRLLRYSLDEDNLECLSRLLTTIGQDIDNEKSHVSIADYYSFSTLNHGNTNVFKC